MQAFEVRRPEVAGQAARAERTGVVPEQHLKTFSELVRRVEERSRRAVRTFDARIPSLTPEAAKWFVKSFYYVLQGVAHRAPSFPSILLIGPPGVGKSTLVREVAREIAEEQGREFVDITSDENQMRLYEEIEGCGGDSACLRSLADKYFVFLDLRLTEVEPQDLLGLPRADRGLMRYAPPVWAVVLSHIPGILFLDELTNVERPDVLAASYKLMLDRTAGFVRFDPKVMVVAAGNLASHAPGLARPLPLPLVNRSAVLYVDAPTVEDWYEWTKAKLLEMLEGESDELVRDYLETLELVRAFMEATNGQWLIAVGAGARDADINENAPTPRSWSHLVFATPASALKAMADSEMLHSYVSSFVGTTAAAKFVAVVRTGLRIDYDKVVRDPSELERSIGALEKDKQIEALPVVAYLVGADLARRSMPLEEKVRAARGIGEVLVKLGTQAHDVSIGKSVLEVFMRALMQGYQAIVRERQTEGALDRVMSERDKVLGELNKLKREIETRAA